MFIRKRVVRLCAADPSFFAEVTGGAKGLPRAGPLQSTVFNRLTKYYLNTACPGFFEKLDSEVPRGAVAALETLAASTKSDNREEFLAVLSNGGADKKFFQEWKLALDTIGDAKRSWAIDRVRTARVDTLYTVIGAQRGDQMKGKQFLQLMGQHFVVSPEFAAAIKTPDFKDRATKCLPFLFADGAILRSRVLITVDQIVNDVKQNSVDHLMTLEISLTPRVGKKSILASESILELTEEPLHAGSWTIADVNFAMSDNYPLDPPEEAEGPEGKETKKNEKDDHKDN